MIKLFSSVEEADDYIKQYQTETSSVFNTRGVKNYGGEFTDLDKHKVLWEESKSNAIGRAVFDGVPFIILGTKTMECQHGPNRNPFPGGLSGRRSNVPPKKVGCQAIIRLKRLIRFPQYKIESDGKYAKYTASKSLRDDFQMDPSKVVVEERIIVKIEGEHDHSGKLIQTGALGSNEVCQDLDPRIIEKIHELVKRGLRDETRIRALIQEYARRQLKDDDPLMESMLVLNDATVTAHMAELVEQLRAEEEEDEKKRKSKTRKKPAASPAKTLPSSINIEDLPYYRISNTDDGCDVILEISSSSPHHHVSSVAEKLSSRLLHEIDQSPMKKAKKRRSDSKGAAGSVKKKRTRKTVSPVDTAPTPRQIYVIESVDHDTSSSIGESGGVKSETPEIENRFDLYIDKEKKKERLRREREKKIAALKAGRRQEELKRQLAEEKRRKMEAAERKKKALKRGEEEMERKKEERKLMHQGLLTGDVSTVATMPFMNTGSHVIPTHKGFNLTVNTEMPVTQTGSPASASLPSQIFLGGTSQPSLTGSNQTNANTAVLGQLATVSTSMSGSNIYYVMKHPLNTENVEPIASFFVFGKIPDSMIYIPGKQEVMNLLPNQLDVGYVIKKVTPAGVKVESVKTVDKLEKPGKQANEDMDSANETFTVDEDHPYCTGGGKKSTSEAETSADLHSHESSDHTVASVPATSLSDHVTTTKSQMTSKSVDLSFSSTLSKMSALVSGIGPPVTPVSSNNATVKPSSLPRAGNEHCEDINEGDSNEQSQNSVEHEAGVDSCGDVIEYVELENDADREASENTSQAVVAELDSQEIQQDLDCAEVLSTIPVRTEQSTSQSDYSIPVTPHATVSQHMTSESGIPDLETLTSQGDEVSVTLHDIVHDQTATLDKQESDDIQAQLLQEISSEDTEVIVNRWKHLYDVAYNDYAGYVTSFEKLGKLLEKYEIQTTTQFAITSMTRHFGSISDDFFMKKFFKSKVKLSEQGNDYLHYMADGIPYIVYGTRRHHCAWMRKRPPAPVVGKRRKSPARCALLNDCSAGIKIRHVVKFPQYKVDLNKLTKYQKQRLVRLLKDDVVLDSKTIREHRIYVFLPQLQDHKDHPVGMAAAEHQRLDRRVIQKIIQLMRNGYRDMNMIQKALRLYVRDELLEGYDVPSNNRRFFPKANTLRNHIHNFLVTPQLKLKEAGEDRKAVLEIVSDNADADEERDNDYVNNDMIDNDYNDFEIEEDDGEIYTIDEALIQQLDQLPVGIATANTRIQKYIRRTPLMFSHHLSISTNVYIKLESEQVSGSFKARGAYNKMLSLAEDDPMGLLRGVVTASSGNHGIACVYAAKSVNCPLEIYCSCNVDPNKVEALTSLGVKPNYYGQNSLEAEQKAQTVAERKKITYISPYNDIDIIAGHGTVALEINEDLPNVDCILVPVGGGGLIGGIAAYMKRVKPSVEIIGCQPRGCKVMFESIKMGKVLHRECSETMADALAGQLEKNTMTFALCRHLVDDWLLVTEEQITSAVYFMHSKHNKLIEGSGGVAVAAFMANRKKFMGKTVVIIACGANIASRKIRDILNTYCPD